MKKVRIGAGTGYYGDTLWPALEIVKNGNVDYLCFDCLAELTMAILQKDHQRNPEYGYTKDFGNYMKELLPICIEKGIKIVTNAGGVNPYGAKRKIESVLNELGLSCKISVVTGDNLIDFVDELKEQDLLVNMQNGAKFLPNEHEIAFANAYLGARPLVEALKNGADVVISGRTSDAAQFAAPLIYEFGWEWDAWDELARAMTIGHLMECSGQAVGGNFSGDWESVDFVNIGFPIAEVDETGESIITKVPGTGGLVSKDTLKEQLLYEVHDPYNYILPDVVVNIADTKLEDIGKDMVRVYGTTGKPATDTYKALIGYNNGYLGEAVISYSWPDALKKAKRASEILIANMERAKIEYEDVHVSFMGYDSLHGPLSNPDPNLNEVYLRLAIHAKTKDDANRFGRLVPPLSLSGPPFNAMSGGMRKPRQLLGICPILIPKEMVDSKVRVEVS